MFLACFYDIGQTIKHILVFFLHVLGPLTKAKEYFNGALHHFLMSAAKALEILQLVCNMELLVISKMSEFGSQHKACF